MLAVQTQKRFGQIGDCNRFISALVSFCILSNDDIRKLVRNSEISLDRHGFAKEFHPIRIDLPCNLH